MLLIAAIWGLLTLSFAMGWVLRNLILQRRPKKREEEMRVEGESSVDVIDLREITSRTDGNKERDE